MKWFLVTLLLVIFTAESQAKVLIYKGTLKIVTIAPPVALPKVLNTYILVDPDTAQFTTVAYFALNGTKKQSKGPPTAMHMTSAVPSNGKTETAIVSDADVVIFTDATHFEAVTTDLIGINATLSFNTGGGVETTSFPRVLVFSAHAITANAANGSIQVLTGLVSYQTKLSETDNNAGKTLQESTDFISAGLLAKGYQP
jgi:hypothetical protein